MATLTRAPVGEPVIYRGKLIQVRYMGPDLLCYVEDVELNAFYLTRQAALKGAERYVDDQLKSADDKQRKEQRQ